MKIFLSALENFVASNYDGKGSKMPLAEYLVQGGVHLKWNLMSYYYIRVRRRDLAKFIRDHSEEILIDSGAHSFQKGKKVDWVEYTKEYAEFIRWFDNDKVLGYFEMDVDNVLGYDKVLELRKILEGVSDKIIPVWHKNRGIDEFKKMCEDYSGKIVAITGFKNEDIKDDQYLMFVKYAKEHNCKIHCLGMTRKKILDQVPFDYTDSSSWVQRTLYGKIKERKVTQAMSKSRRFIIAKENYLIGQEMQKHYFKKWRNV